MPLVLRLYSVLGSPVAFLGGSSLLGEAEHVGAFGVLGAAVALVWR